MTELKVFNVDCMEYFKTLEDKSIFAIITDPPYGIDFQSNQRVKTPRKTKIANDLEPHVEWLPEAARVLRDDGCLLTFCRWDVEDAFADAIRSTSLELKSQVIWDKGTHGMGDLDGQFAPAHENMWFATKPGFKFWGDRPKSIISVSRVGTGQIEHPNEKPVALLKKLVYALVPRGMTVMDPFCGSGSTGVACAMLDRNFIGCEIMPEYYKIARERVDNQEMQLVLFV